MGSSFDSVREDIIKLQIWLDSHCQQDKAHPLMLQLAANLHQTRSTLEQLTVLTK